MDKAETDYLVVGSGAVGMAFTDTILDETDAHVTIVDRYPQPGGHWTKAYPFVRLHQPSAYYGVASRPLGSGRRYAGGLNAGLCELASAAEIVAYYEAVLSERFLPSRRVNYLPMTEYAGDGRLVSLVSGDESHIVARRRVVDATYADVAVPATHPPRYRIAAGVELTTPGRLPDTLRERAARPGPVALVGGGKTAVDVALWLLSCGLPAGRVTWIIPRDPWFLDRRGAQPGLDFFDESIGAYAARLADLAKAASPMEVFTRYERDGHWMRLDPGRQPGMFHNATVSRGELDRLRTITNVVRLGRVVSIDGCRVHLERGDMDVDPGTIFVDCSASANSRRPSVPIFREGHIVPQVVRAPLNAFSASLVAYVEAHFADDVTRNALCMPIRMPDAPDDVVEMTRRNLLNDLAWSKHAHLRRWIRNNRLDAFGSTLASIGDDQEKLAVLQRIRESIGPAIRNLDRLTASQRRLAG